MSEVATPQRKPPPDMAAEVESKRQRYYIEQDSGQSIILGDKVHRLAVCLTKRDKAEEPLLIVLYNLHTACPNWEFRGPAWKRHHSDLYFWAALLELRARGGKLPEVGTHLSEPPVPVPVQLPSMGAKLPFPPKGPPCPQCGAAMEYDCRHVGGRGTCWRHICPAECGYVERWKS